MRIDTAQIKKLSKERGLSINLLLSRSQTSKTAYYSLVHRKSILPGTVHKLAEALGVDPANLVTSKSDAQALYLERITQLEEVLKLHPNSSRENVWHTLVLLEQKPIERLRGALRRAGK